MENKNKEIVEYVVEELSSNAIDDNSAIIDQRNQDEHLGIN